MRYKLITILLILFVCGQALATNYYYIQADGSDSNTGATEGTNAWKTVGHALGAVTFPAEIRVEPGTYTETTSKEFYWSTSKALTINGWNNGQANTDPTLVVLDFNASDCMYWDSGSKGTITLTNLTLRNIKPSPGDLIDFGSGDVNGVVNNCILGNPSDGAPSSGFFHGGSNATPTRSLSITNSTLPVSGYLIEMVGLNGLIFTGNTATITGAGTSAGAIWISGVNGPITITGNSITDTSAKPTIFLNPSGTPLPDVNISNNPTFSTVNMAISDYNVNSLTVNGNAFTESSAGTISLIQLDHTSVLKNVRITNNIFHPNSTNPTINANYSAGAAPDLNNVIITGNTFTSTFGSAGAAISVSGTKNTGSNIFVADNTITLAMGTAGSYGIQIGLDGGITDPIGNAVIRHNVVTLSGAQAKHAVIVGNNVQSGEVAYDTVMGGNYQIVIKGQKINVHHNIANGPCSLLLKGASNCNVFNNTCHSTGSYAFGLSSQNDVGFGVVYQSHNQIYNNIFDGAGATYAIGTDADSYGVYGVSDNYINFNCYVNGTSGFADIELTANTATVIPDLATMKADWLTWANHGVVNFPLNDVNSISADPRFRNKDTNDFSLLPSSPCINAVPTLDGGKSTPGAWQPPKQNSSVILVGW
ncbi:MAG: hypothetical protein ABSG22_10600 [Sedimentisphaerales bacterium]